MPPGRVLQLHPNTARVVHEEYQFEVSTFKGCQRQNDNFSAYLDASELGRGLEEDWA